MTFLFLFLGRNLQMKFVNHEWFKFRYAKKSAMGWLLFWLILGFAFAAISSCQNDSPKEIGKVTLWPNGSFIKYEHNPILQPTAGFESKSVYNPAVIVENGKFSMLYRAEGENTGTGAIGLAFSEDGIHFERYVNNPVIVGEYEYEKEGVEDPRIVKFGDTFYLTYTGAGDRTTGNICLATSKDLIEWDKKGEILQPRSGAWNSRQIKARAIVPEKINGKNGWNEELMHKTSWTLFSKEEPTDILARCVVPILEST